MKTMKKLLFTLMFVFFAVIISSCAEMGTHVHTYGDWTFIVTPTETTEGTATRSCACEIAQVVNVAALTDETVWSVEVVDPECEKTGLKTYSSVYGKVEVVIPALEHSYDVWTLTTEPTKEAVGEMTRVCAHGHDEKAEVPVLTDETYWTKVVTPAECGVEGSEVYTHDTFTVTVVIPALEHSYGAWTLTTAPTLTAEGSATRTCAHGHDDETVVPALTDSVWTVEHTTLPTYNAKGMDTYTSVYGTVEVEVAKLVAPYDGKTYSSFNLDGLDDNDNYANKKVSVETAWHNQTITFDENGVGEGVGYPFRGLFKAVMVDPATGLMKFDVRSISTDDEGNKVYSEEVRTYNAYVDFTTGVIVMQRDNTFGDVHVLTPFEIGASSSCATASVWGNTLVASYTYEDTTVSFVAYNEVVHFGATLATLDGASVAFDSAFASESVVVTCGDDVLVTFVTKDSKLIVSDGYHGTYTSESHTVVVKGNGELTLNDVAGTYTVEEGVLCAHVDGSYYEITVDGTTCTVVKPMVTITYVPGEYATAPADEVNKRVVAVLPVLTAETHTFRGWFFDSAFEQAVPADFAPEADVTLYAKWTEKTVVYLAEVPEGTPTTIYLGDGDKVLDYLPVFDVVEDKKFIEWAIITEEDTTVIDSDSEISIDDSGVTITAVWKVIPAYAGTYYGTEIWNGGYGNSSKYTLTIDIDGNVSGKINGIVVSYDPVTQVIEWKASATATTVKKFYFDAETGIIAGIYKDNDILNDYYLFSKVHTETSYKANAVYGVKAPKTPGSTDMNDWYAQFANVNTVLGAKDMFFYNNHIYNDVTIKNALGETLAISEIKNSKTVIVIDNKTGATIVSVASQGASFSIEQKVQLLDEYFGTYAFGEVEVVLDGVGTVVWDGKTGTYTLVNAETKTFDVYTETEYYELVLTDASATVTKVMVTVTYVTGDGHVVVPAAEVNKNIPMTLADGTDEGYVFNGWFTTAEYTEEVTSPYTPTASVTLYAKYSQPAVLTIVRNDGSDAEEVTYSVGDIATVASPEKPKFAFAGWYTTEDFTEGTEWTSGTAINADTTIYAKWEAAPIYYNTYYPTEISGSTATGSRSYRYTWSSVAVKFSPSGQAPKASGWPFNSGDISIVDYDAEAGTLKIICGSYERFGYIDPETGIIIIDFNSKSTSLVKTIFLNPFGNGSLSDDTVLSSSYWLSGTARAIEYTFDGTTYSAFIKDGVVYFGATFETTTGVKVSGLECHTSNTLVVKKGDVVIAKYAHDGTQLQELDGYEGTYTSGDETIVVNGVNKITMGDVVATYTHASADSAYTFDAYTADEYFQITVDKETMTFTKVKPMVTITLVEGDYVTVEDLYVNINIEATLPTDLVCDTHVFMGWYTTEEFTTVAPNTFTPTENVTFYAKWAEKIVLTVVKGNGYENATINLYQGQTFDLNSHKPAYKDGMAFGGWYADSEYTVEFTSTSITESTTVYAKWVEKGPYTVTNTSSSASYGFTYADGVWTSGNKGKNGSKSVITITAIDQVTVVVTFWAQSESDYRWDYAYLMLNNSDYKDETGAKVTTGGPKNTVDNAKTVTIVLNAGDKLSILYVKDNSGTGGADQAYITLLTVDGVQVTEYDE